LKPPTGNTLVHTSDVVGAETVALVVVLLVVSVALGAVVEFPPQAATATSHNRTMDLLTRTSTDQGDNSWIIPALTRAPSERPGGRPERTQLLNRNGSLTSFSVRRHA
jgi:hypothetical protein